MNQMETSIPTRAITLTIGRAKPDTIRLWTLQPLWVWDRLREQEILLSDPTGEEVFHSNQESYDWMREQMRRHLPDYQGHYPWWAHDYKPDLRHQHTDDRGQYVRLELSIPREKVLLSAYGAWHFVLHSWYLPQAVDEEDYSREDDAWEEELSQHGLDPYKNHPLPEPWFSRMVTSWERIFDVDDLRETNSIQACFELLNLKDVVRVTIFTPRYVARTKQRQVATG